MGRSVLVFAFFFVLLALMLMFDGSKWGRDAQRIATLSSIDLAFKAHRDRGGSRREHESLLDKQERDRNEKERKKDDDKKGLLEQTFPCVYPLSWLAEEKRNITCYKCAGDQCNDPFRFENSTPIVLCEFGCWVKHRSTSINRLVFLLERCFRSSSSSRLWK